MILPPKPFPSAALTVLQTTCRHVDCTDRACIFVQTMFNHSVSLTLSPCVSLTIFDLGIELTENPLSKCVPLCRPTWVHSVIPVTGALFSLFSAFCFLRALDYLNGFSFHYCILKTKAAGLHGNSIPPGLRRLNPDAFSTHTPQPPPL